MAFCLCLCLLDCTSLISCFIVLSFVRWLASLIEENYGGYFVASVVLQGHDSASGRACLLQFSLKRIVPISIVSFSFVLSRSNGSPFLFQSGPQAREGGTIWHPTTASLRKYVNALSQP